MTKKIVITEKRFQPATTGVRDQDATTAQQDTFKRQDL